MTVRPLLLAGSLGALLSIVVLSGSAHALSFHKVTDAEVKTTTTGIVAMAPTEDRADYEKMLGLAVHVRPIVDLEEAKCPMPIKVINATVVPLFNVKISVSERRASAPADDRTQTVVHLPYIPAQSYVTGKITCALGTSRYGLRGSGDTFLSASPIGESSKLDEAGIREMIRTKIDASTDATEFHAGSEVNELDIILKRDSGARRADLGKGSILPAILEAIQKDADFKIFTTALLKSTEGARELGAFARRFPFRASVEALGPLLTAAPAAKVAIMLEELMRDDDSRTGALVTVAAARVCGPGQPEEARSAMWLSALAPKVRNIVARDVVLAKCGVGKDQTKARLKAAKGALLGRALEGMTGDLFDVAVAAMAESKSLDAASTLLTDTQNPDKFAAVAKAAAGFVTASPQRQQLLRAVASAKLGALDETKAKWCSDRLDELHAQAADGPALREIFEDMAKGKVSNDTLRTAAFARRKDAGPGALEPFVAALDERSHVLVTSWVIAQAEAGKLDLVALLNQVGPSMRSSWVDGDRNTDRDTDDDVETVTGSASDDDDLPGSAVGTAKGAASGTAKGAASAMPKNAARGAATGTARGAATGTAKSSLVPGTLFGGNKSASKAGSGCEASASAADACLGKVRHLALTKEAIDPVFVEAAKDFVESNPRDDTSIKVIKELAALGIDITSVVEGLCKAAPTTASHDGYGGGASDPLNSAASLNAGAACITTVRALRGSSERWLLAGQGMRLALAFVPFGFVALLARRRFVPVRAQLAKENAELEAVRGKAAVTERLEGGSWDGTITGGIADAARWLATDASEEVASAGRALAALPAETLAALVTRTRALASRAVETGTVTTCLCELDGLVLYLACFPGREDQPQTVRRHRAFAGGWSPHARAVLDACAADGKPKRMLSLISMLGTDGTRAAMFVAYDSADVHLVPESLLTDPIKADANARPHDHRYETSSSG